MTFIEMLVIAVVVWLSAYIPLLIFCDFASSKKEFMAIFSAIIAIVTIQIIGIITNAASKKKSSNRRRNKVDRSGHD
jgi:hypothetical protein